MSSPNNEFMLIDILEQRRNHSDVAWISKSFHPKQAYIRRNKQPHPLLFQYRILIDKNIHVLLQKVYTNQSISSEFHMIENIVKEIGYLKSISVVRSLGLLLIKIMKKTMQSVFVTESKLLKIKCNMGKNPVIFLPTHRSYADFILMAFLCFNYDIEIPVVVAGMDFYAMFGMATLLRRCGAMYMRRSFKDDKIYGAIFKKYVQTVIANGNSPFEFFIEGTRSRCGKSLSPKLGLLKMVVEVFLTKEVDDITFVPITINYDRLIEDYLFTREVLGIPKPKESTTGLLKGISMLEEQYGNIYVNIGEEISAKKFFEQNNYDQSLLPHLAHLIVSRQQGNTIVTFFNLLCAVVIHCLLNKESKILKTSLLAEESKKLKDLLVLLGAIVIFKDNVYEEIQRNLKIHKFLIHNFIEDSIEIVISKEKSASREVINHAIPFILLQHYSNCCYFFLINPAILISILRLEKRSTRGSLLHKFKWFRTLFKYEFAFYQNFDLEDFNTACQKLVDLNVIQILNDEINFLGHESIVTFVCNLLVPYLKGYLFICQSLVTIGNRTFEEIRLKSRIKKQLEVELDFSNDISLFYALSSHFQNCTFSSLLDAQILSSNKINNSITISNLEKLEVVINFLSFLMTDNFDGENKHRISSVCAKL